MHYFRVTQHDFKILTQHVSLRLKISWTEYPQSTCLTFTMIAVKTIP